MGKFSLAAIAIAFSALASASSFDNLYVFGDSLSDTGNVYALTGGHTPPAPYYHGRFSNGPVWVESLANHLGLSVDPSLNGGTNYAFGGAEADRSHTLSHDNTPNIGYQITQFSASHSFTGHELVVVWAGGNDFLKGSIDPAHVASDVTASLNQLYSLGARNFLVNNLPLLGETPQIVGTPYRSFVDGLSATFNTDLANDLTSFSSLSGNHVYKLDVAALQRQVLHNPSAYGLTDVSHAYLFTGGDVNKFFYWDDIHPTARMHDLIGKAAAQAVPEPASMLALALGAGLLTRRRAR